MRVRDNRGSITIFVLVGLLFMSAFLLISYAYNVNKSKVAQEQFNIISEIYSPNKSDEESYTDAYTTLRKKNAKVFSFDNEEDADNTIFENTKTVELTKTFEGNFSNYRIYGNSIQNGTPSPSQPIEIQSLGDNTVNLIPFPYYIESQTISGITVTVNLDGSVTLNGTATSGISTLMLISKSNPIKFKAGTYTLSGNPISTGVRVWFREVNSSTNLISSYKGNHATITLDEDTEMYCYISINDGTTINNETIYPQLQHGSTATQYEPYGKYKIPISITDENGNSTLTNIYLEEPLRKVGDYADYIDFKTGKIVRNVSSFIMSNSLKFNSTAEDRTIIRNARNSILTTSNAGMSMIWKYEYPQKNVNTAFLYTGNGYFYWYPDVTVFGVNFGDDNATIKDPKLQEWLAKQSDEIKTVYYVLATPDDSEAISLPELKTYEDYTKIEVLTEIMPSKIEVTYEGYTLE